jgi:hypothetical protein
MLPASHFRPIGYLSDACGTQPVDTEAKTLNNDRAAAGRAAGRPGAGP